MLVSSVPGESRPTSVFGAGSTRTAAAEATTVWPAGVVTTDASYSEVPASVTGADHGASANAGVEENASAAASPVKAGLSIDGRP